VLLTTYYSIKSRKMRWAAHVACMGDGRSAYRVLVRDLTRREHLEDVDRRIILKCITLDYSGS